MVFVDAANDFFIAVTVMNCSERSSNYIGYSTTSMHVKLFLKNCLQQSCMKNKFVYADNHINELARWKKKYDKKKPTQKQ